MSAPPTPPAGAYSSPCLPPEWSWQYSPEVDEVYFIHQPTDARQWEHPEGQGQETAFYQWLGAQLGSGGFAGSHTPSPPPFSPGPSSPPLSHLAPPGAPLARAFSAPNTGSGAAADFYNAPAPTSHEYADAFSPSSEFPTSPLPGPGMDGVSDRGLFSHGFGKPVKQNAGWSFKLKDFFVGDFSYRPPPPRPQALKPSHHAFMGPAPGANSTHAPTFGTFKPPSLNYGRPNSYNAEYMGPEPLITPFPPPAMPSKPSPPPAYQQSFSHQPSYQQPNTPQQTNPYHSHAPAPPYADSASSHYSTVSSVSSTSIPTNPYPQQHQPPQQNQPPRPTNPYAQSQARPTNPYAQQTQNVPGVMNQNPPKPQQFSPTMNALAQSGNAAQGYVPSYNQYAPRPQGSGAYVPGKINAGAFKPRPRGMDGEDDSEWQGEQPVEWAQPVYGGPHSPPLPPQQQWGPPASGQWQ